MTTIMSSIKKFSHATAKGSPTVTTDAVVGALVEQAAAGRTDAIVRLEAGKHFPAESPSPNGPALMAQIGLTNAAKRFGVPVSVHRDGDRLDVTLRGVLNSESARERFGAEVVDAALANGVEVVSRDPRGRRSKG